MRCGCVVASKKGSFCLLKVPYNKMPTTLTAGLALVARELENGMPCK